MKHNHDTKVIATKDQFLSCIKYSLLNGTVAFLQNPLRANPTKWSNNLPTNCLSVFDHSVILALKRLRNNIACCSFKFWDSLLIEVTKM